MQKANRAHMLYAMMTFIQLQSFLYILFYLGVASVIGSMEFSETFYEMKLLVAMVTMMSFIVFAHCIPSCALECAEFNSAFILFKYKKVLKGYG